MFHPSQFYATQIILNSRISANDDKVEELSANVKILIKEIVFVLDSLET